MDSDVHLRHHRKPKGVVRSHGAGALLSLVTEIELGHPSRPTGRCWSCPCAMPTRSTSSARFSYCGGATTVYSRKSFDPEHCVRALAETGASFTSLVPTHYIMMLGLPSTLRERKRT